MSEQQRSINGAMTACSTVVGNIFLPPSYKNVRTFDTVADMQAATDLVDGAVCHTLGFHAVGDGGAAWYEIKSTGTANAMDIIACQDSLLAHLVIEEVINFAQFGMQEGNSNDNSSIFNYVMDNYLTGDKYYHAILPQNKKYYFSNDIHINNHVSLDANNALFVYNGSNQYFINMGSFIYLKNINLQGIDKTKDCFKLGNGNDTSSTRNDFTNVYCAYWNTAFDCQRGWIINFNNINCGHVNTCFNVSGAFNNINIVNGDYELDIIDFFNAESTASVRGLNVKNACIEGITGQAFKFNSTTAEDIVNIDGCYFEYNEKDASGIKPLITSNSSKSEYKITGITNAYMNPIIGKGNFIVDDQLTWKIIDDLCLMPKAQAVGQTPYFIDLCTNPILSNYSTIIDFNKIGTMTSIGSIFETTEYPDLFFMFKNTAGSWYSNTTIDFNIDEFTDVIVHVKKWYNTKIATIFDVVFNETNGTIESHGKMIQNTGYDGTNQTSTWSTAFQQSLPQASTTLRQQFTIASGMVAGTQGGKSFVGKFHLGITTDTSFKINQIGIA